MGKKKEKPKELTDVESVDENSDIPEVDVVDELFGSLKDAKASVVASSVTALTTNAIVVRVGQNLLKPKYRGDWQSGIIVLSQDIQDNTSYPETTVNDEGFRKIRNIVNNMRYAAKRHALAIFNEGGNSVRDETSGRIADAFNLQGYLMTKEAFKIFLPEWEAMYRDFEIAVDKYIEAYPEERNNLTSYFGKQFLYNKLQQVANDVKEIEIVGNYSTKEDMDLAVNAVKESLEEMVDFFKINLGGGLEKPWVAYAIILNPSGITAWKSIRENYQSFMENVNLYKHLPMELQQSDYGVKMIPQRIPQSDEILTAQRNRMEMQFETGVRKMNKDMKIEGETAYQATKATLANIEKEYQDLLKQSLTSALKETLDNVRSLKGNVDRRTTRVLLGQPDGKKKKVGLLKEILALAKEGFELRDCNDLEALILDLKGSLESGDAKQVALDLESTLKSLTTEIIVSKPAKVGLNLGLNKIKKPKTKPTKKKVGKLNLNSKK